MSGTFLLYGTLIIASVLIFSGACGVIVAQALKKFAPRTSEDQLPAAASGILVTWGVMFMTFIFVYSYLMDRF